MVCGHTLEKMPPSQKEQNRQNQGIMAEVAVELIKMMELPSQSQPNPGLRAYESPFISSLKFPKWGFKFQNGVSNTTRLGDVRRSGAPERGHAVGVLHHNCARGQNSERLHNGAQRHPSAHRDQNEKPRDKGYYIGYKRGCGETAQNGFFAKIEKLLCRI